MPNSLRPRGLNIRGRDLVLVAVAEMSADIIHDGGDLLIAQRVPKGGMAL